MRKIKGYGLGSIVRYTTEEELIEKEFMPIYKKHVENQYEKYDRKGNLISSYEVITPIKKISEEYSNVIYNCPYPGSWKIVKHTCVTCGFTIRFIDSMDTTYCINRTFEYNILYED